MLSLRDLRIHIYADGADLAGILELRRKPYIRGITTNPSLMRKAGVTDYAGFAAEVLSAVKDLPVSFEVFADEFPEMRRQALKLAALAPNVFVKIPITNSRGESALPLVKELSADGVQLNVTAILSLAQVRATAAALDPKVAAIVSVFAGRVADTGVDPVPLMQESKAALSGLPRALLLWASVREVLNLLQADACGCDIVTVTHDILQKAERMLGIDPESLSLDTVRMFARDAAAAGYRL